MQAHPLNPKIHPRTQTDAVKGIISEVGWITGLIVNKRTGNCLDGHDRVKAAAEAGQATVPVFYVDVAEAEEPYILATFDPSGALAATDASIFDELLRQVQSSESAVQQMLSDAAARLGLYDHAPSLEDLTAQYGDEPESRAFWPTIKVQVAPDTKQRYDALLKDWPGVVEAARFAALVDRAEAA
jgi:hypothetical protein